MQWWQTEYQMPNTSSLQTCLFVCLTTTSCNSLNEFDSSFLSLNGTWVANTKKALFPCTSFESGASKLFPQQVSSSFHNHHVIFWAALCSHSSAASIRTTPLSTDKGWLSYIFSQTKKNVKEERQLQEYYKQQHEMKGSTEKSRYHALVNRSLFKKNFSNPAKEKKNGLKSSPE